MFHIEGAITDECLSIRERRDSCVCVKGKRGGWPYKFWAAVMGGSRGGTATLGRML